MAGSGIAAGAAAGTAVMPGIGTAIGGLLGGAMDMFGGGSNSSSPAGPSILDALTSTSVDFSGWTVATHGSSASATSSKTATPDMASSLLNGTGSSSQLLVFGVIAVAALVAIKIFKK